MKRIIGTGFLVLATAAWIFITSYHYSGLNNVQQLASYHGGLLNLQQLTKHQETIIPNQQEAEVHIDSLGIPHIYANNRNDIAFALGYIHARDRYFQMELIAHSVMGELSTIIGEPGLGSDYFWKKFDLEKRATACLDSLSKNDPALYQYLTTYAKGVNAYVLDEKESNRDPLYSIWHYSPQPWKASYTFLIQWYMSSQLAYYDDYFNRQEVLDKIPDSIRQILYPTQPVDQPCIIPGNVPVKQTDNRERSLVKLFKAGEPNTFITKDVDRSLGSNNWVINSAHTRSGETFLCNDLHLFLTSPNVFYEVHLSGAGMHVYGYSIPGVPLVLTGHNEKIAWGVTNGGWDVTEQYMLTLNPKNRDQYWLNGQWQAVTKKDFTIQVKGGAAQNATVKYTVFGPVDEKDSRAWSTRWHPLQSCNAISSFWKLMQAANWNDFNNALHAYDYPAQNFVYADVQGNIGMICAGKMPVKPAGYAGGIFDGTVLPEEQYIPFDSLPRSYNPAQGYLFSANQQPQPGNRYYSSRWFDDLYRPRRINELLSGNNRYDIESIRQVQLDRKDLSAGDLKTLLNTYCREEKLSANWESMRTWDGELVPGQQQAVFYQVFRKAAQMADRELANSLQVKAAPQYDQFMHFLLSDRSVSFGNNSINSRECFKRVVTLADSLYNSLQPSSFNPYTFHIPQMTYLPGLNMEVNDLGGSENTINVSYGAHSVVRTVIKIKDTALQSWMVNAIGQTGRLNDNNYYQQLAAWKKNTLHKTQFTRYPQQLGYITENIFFKK